VNTNEAAGPRDDDRTGGCEMTLRVWHLFGLAAGSLAATVATATVRSPLLVVVAFIGATSVALAAFQISFRFDGPERRRALAGTKAFFGALLLDQRRLREAVSEVGWYTASIVGGVSIGVLSVLVG
jgi:uncharacterized membrane protein YedE/YeeE